MIEALVLTIFALILFLTYGKVSEKTYDVITGVMTFLFTITCLISFIKVGFLIKNLICGG